MCVDHCSDINECASEISPCQHEGTCIDVDGSYSCACPTGYTGFFCQDGELHEGAACVFVLCFTRVNLFDIGCVRLQSVRVQGTSLTKA